MLFKKYFLQQEFGFAPFGTPKQYSFNNIPGGANSSLYIPYNPVQSAYSKWQSQNGGPIQGQQSNQGFQFQNFSPALQNAINNIQMPNPNGTPGGNEVSNTSSVQNNTVTSQIQNTVPPTPNLDLSLNTDARSLVKDPKDIKIPDAPIIGEEPSKDPSKFSQFMGKVGGVMSNPMFGQAADAAGNLVQSIGQIAGAKDMYAGPHGQLTQALDQGFDKASDLVMKINPLAGGIMKAASLGNKIQNVALGNKALDGMTTQDAIFASPLGFMGLGLINALGGQNADTITKNEEAFSTVGSSYAGTGNAVDDALTKSGKRYGLFSGNARKQANREIAEATRQQNTMSNIADDASMRSQLQSTMTDINAVANSFRGAGGYQQANVRAAKFGMRLERAKAIANKPKITFEIIYNETPKFKNGGTIIEKEIIIEKVIDEEIQSFEKGGEVNLIPEGALHARKHHLEEIDENLKGNITSKGIPVISESEGGEIQQHAEIEHSELILRLSVTEQIEEARKKYESDDTKQSEKDQLAIEIGKLLVQEILYNTDDRTNLINDE